MKIVDGAAMPVDGASLADVGDANGFFIRCSDGERFRARRVAVVPAEAGSFVRDLETGAWSPCGWSHDTERHYEVISYVETADDHADKLGVFERLFRAAVSEGTRAVWC